jgi:hypothetical protein
MALKLKPMGILKVWSDPANNVIEGPGSIASWRAASAFKRVQWKSDDFDLDTHIGMGGFMSGPQVANVEVRVAFRDKDNVRIFLEYMSRVDMPTHRAGETPAYLAGRVDVDDTAKKYAWLNRTQVVGRGMFDVAEHALVYEMYALE